MEKVEIYVQLCRDGVSLPEYANENDAGMDVCAACDVMINPGETVIIPTGLKIAIPVGYEIQIRPRSGISAKNPLRIPNSPGTIDAGYRDELGVIMSNVSGNEYKNGDIFNIGEKGNKQGTYLIKKGDRIAQMVLQKVPQIKFIQTDDINRIGTNRGGGFGSSGI